MNLFVQLLLIILFDSYSVIFIVPSILYIVAAMLATTFDLIDNYIESYCKTWIFW